VYEVAAIAVHAVQVFLEISTQFGLVFDVTLVVGEQLV
jgi:hypothetical protein